MAERKKPKSVDEIISEYQKFHHKAGKGFKDRIKKFEEFNDPENIHRQQFAHHAHYTVFGKPGKEKEYPGAYNVTYQVLDKLLEDDADKLEDEDKLAQILETYADTVLQKSMGDKFRATMEHAEKEGKWWKKDLREFKGELMGQFLPDNQGHPTNIFSEPYMKNLKGKKKIELVEHLKSLSERVREGYANHLQQKALEGLISEDDRLDMAKYVSPIFEERGLKHKKPHITRSAGEQASHYGALLQGGTETLIKEAGYKPIKYQKKEEKKK